MAAPNKVGDGVLRASPVDERRNPVGLFNGATVLTDFDPPVKTIAALAANTTGVFTLPPSGYRVFVPTVSATELVRLKTGPWEGKIISAIADQAGKMRLTITAHGLMGVGALLLLQSLRWTGINEVHYGHGVTATVVTNVDVNTLDVDLNFPTGGTYTASSGSALHESFAPTNLAFATDADAQAILLGPGPHEIVLPEGNGSNRTSDADYSAKWTQLAVRHNHVGGSDVHLYPKF